LKFWVNAPAQWSVVWDGESSAVTCGYSSYSYPRKEIASGSVFQPESHYLWLGVDENDTGAVRDVAVQFTCGNQTLEIIIRQLPCLYSRLLAPEFIAEYTSIEGDMPRFSKDEPLTLIWETTKGASKYKLLVYDSYCGIPSGIEWPATDEATTSITLNEDFFDDLWMKDFDLRGLELETEDEWGHVYYDKVYSFHVIMDPEHPDYVYSLYWDDDTSALAGVSILQYLVNAAELTIPSTLGGYATRCISGAFHSNDVLTHVTIPEGVEVLYWAFKDCPNLTCATLPASLNYISEDTFSGCPSLETIIAEEGSYAYCWAVQHGYISADTAGFATRKLADGTLEIAGYSGNETNLTLPGEMDGIAVTSIGKNAFRDNAALKSVTIPQGVTRISYGAFEKCANLAEINLPKGMTRIGDYAFMNCMSLTQIALPDGLVSIGFSSFEETGLTNIEIPEGVTEIGEFAFYSCDDLELAIIHEGVKHISECAFDCDGLTCICIPKSVVYIENDFRDNLSTVYGIPGSYTQTWAEENGYTFIDWTTRQPDIPVSNPIVIDEANFPDDVFREYVRQFDLNGNGELSKGEIKWITDIEVDDMGISSIEGIQFFSHLTILNCSYNILTTLDVGSNTNLQHLGCDNNQLKELDISNNTALSSLQCDSNQLTELDVSNNTALTILACGYNHLTTIDVSQNKTLRSLYCWYNQFTALDLSNNLALTSLDCSDNQLTELSLNECAALESLVCAGNKLAELNTRNIIALKSLYCYDNPLATLDVSQNINLAYLYCANNQLAQLDVTNNTALLFLFCYDNSLTELNLYKNTLLTDLDCSNNLLTSLDVHCNRSLNHLECYNNQLSELDVTGIPSLVACLTEDQAERDENDGSYIFNNSSLCVDEGVRLTPTPNKTL